MQLNQILDSVQERAHLESPERTLEVIRATLETLRERLTGGEANDLAAQLPEPLSLYLRGDTAAGRPYTREEFYERVAQKEDVNTQEASEHVQAVLECIGGAVSDGELRDILAQLPKEYEELFGRYD